MLSHMPRKESGGSKHSNCFLSERWFPVYENSSSHTWNSKRLDLFGAGKMWLINIFIFPELALVFLLGGKKKEEEEGCSSRQGPGSSWIQGVSAMKSPFRDAHVNLIY